MHDDGLWYSDQGLPKGVAWTRESRRRWNLGLNLFSSRVFLNGWYSSFLYSLYTFRKKVLRLSYASFRGACSRKMARNFILVTV